MFATSLQINLILSKKYKIITTAFMLALYAFIATPVSYWHQHKKYDTSKAQIEQKIYAKASKTVVDANCKICSHHYAVSNNDAVVLVIPAIKKGSSLIGFCLTKNILNPGYSHSNKGPPAFA